MDDHGKKAVTELLESGSRARLYTHAAAAWQVDGRETQAIAGAATPATRFDLASLTKPFVTAYAIQSLAHQKAVDIDEPLGVAWGETHRLRVPSNWAAATPRQLLTHTSDAPAYLAPYDQPSLTRNNRTRLLQAILDAPWIVRPEIHRYSCLNFIVLKHWADSLHSGGLEEWWARELRVGHLGAPASHDVAPTSPTLAEGETHDPLSRCLGGYGGNAGLFASVQELTPFIRHLASLPESWGCDYWQAQSDHTRTSGWDMASDPQGAAAAFSDGGIGHYGFTGTSLWFSRCRQNWGLLLTNRVHPSSWWRSLELMRKSYHQTLRQLSA